MKSWLGVRMLSHRNIGAIVNVDIDTATPVTVMMMNKALLSARSGEAGRTFIFCHPMVKLYLDQIGKTEFMNTSYGDSRADFQLETWNGVPIVTSYNFVEGAETNISL